MGIICCWEASVCPFVFSPLMIAYSYFMNTINIGIVLSVTLKCHSEPLSNMMRKEMRYGHGSLPAILKGRTLSIMQSHFLWMTLMYMPIHFFLTKRTG